MSIYSRDSTTGILQLAEELGGRCVVQVIFGNKNKFSALPFLAIKKVLCLAFFGNKKSSAPCLFWATNK